MKCKNKSFKHAAAIAESHGFYLHRSRNHLIWRHDCGAQVSTSCTPSDHRALKNFAAQLRRSVAHYSLQAA